MSAAVKTPSFSVVVPAHDAAATLAKTLDSLLAQTHAEWEAIVVDDGSADATADIAAAYAARDARIRLVRQRQAGEGGARNTAVNLARNDWLLFLDADDWVVPETLACFAAAIAADSALDAIHCGWVHVDTEGRTFGEHHCTLTGDLFDALAASAQFPVHACVVRRALVIAAGGFDTTLRSCADWDMWQRIARGGARFGSVPEALSWYRLRPNNTWTGGKQFLSDGLRLVAQGHAPDGRVSAPLPQHAEGRARTELPYARFTFVCAPAAMELARGGDPRAFLEALPDDPAPDLDPAGIAHVLFYSAPRSLCRDVDWWAEAWPHCEERLEKFLAALEGRAQASGLARRTARAIEALLLTHALTARPQTVGTTHAVRVEVTEPIHDVVTGPRVERLECAVTLEGDPLGTVSLPVCDGMVSSAVLADAIAAEFAWRILGRWFQRTVYRELEARAEPEGVTVARRGVVLVSKLKRDAHRVADWAHETVGWTVFLQELWGHPDWPRERFFDKTPDSQPALCLRAGEWIVCEASAELPEIVEVQTPASVVLTVGGAALGVVEVNGIRGRIGAEELRAELTSAGGIELCRIAVREAVLGRPLASEPASLRERLAIVCAAKIGASSPTRWARSRSERELSPWELSLPAEVVHGWPNPIVAAPSRLRPGLVLARRAHGVIGSSASRRAAIPLRAAAAVQDCAAAASELALRTRWQLRKPRVAHVPEVIWRPASANGRAAASTKPGSAVTPVRKNEGPPPASSGTTDRLPILMYHRVATHGAPATARYRLAPAAFEQQLRVLRDAGCRSIDLAEWREAAWSRRPLEGRPIVLTFDDGHADFATEAWPLLVRYGFTALVFVVADRIGQAATWEAMRGEQPELLGWEEIRRLASEGCAFGSHSATHPRLNGLDPATAVNEMARSRAILSRGLGTPVDSIAYPHGAQDAVVRHLAGACGYTFGLSCEPGLARFDDSLLALPRIEVRSDMTVGELQAAVGITEPETKTAHA